MTLKANANYRFKIVWNKKYANCKEYTKINDHETIFFFGGLLKFYVAPSFGQFGVIEMQQYKLQKLLTVIQESKEQQQDGAINYMLLAVS